MFVKGEKHVLMDAAGDAASGGGAGSAAGAAGDAAGAAAGGSGAAAGANVAAPWHGLTGPDDVAYVDNKAWKTTADVIAGYRNAEKLIGRDPNTLLAIPKADDTAGMRAVFSKLGMPETPDKYEFDVPQGATPDENFIKWGRTTFHELGLTAAQAKALTGSYNQFVASGAEREASEYNNRVNFEKQELLAEWRDGHDRMINSAKAAANALGFSKEMIDSMEKTVGYKGTYKFLAGLGQKLSEDGFVSGDKKGGGFGMQTPAEAKAEWDSMKLDANVQKALFDKAHPGHLAATEKQSRLFKIMFPT